MRILEELKGSSKIAIGGHIRPDGDCIGSCMGLSLFLKKAMPDAQVDVFLEKPADIFLCIKDADKIITDSSAELHYDAFVALDTNAERLGAFRKYFDAADLTINIDHHISNKDGSAMINYIKPQASSASELVFEVIDREYLDAEIAKALYIGIIHDTGVLQYSNTAPSTLKTAAELIGYGLDFTKIIDETFYEKTFVQNRLLGRALSKAESRLFGKCIVSCITAEELAEFGADSKDLEGIVSQLRYTRGAECAVFLHELKEQEFKVSMRSNGKVDVAKVASVFGGGGHVRAAGCTLTGTPKACVEILLPHIEKQL
ncbi:MAG: bifunctional oligoribonuclease/PAP phosphatase NrnA [Lachnospiraceae bacterium]|nr:bifunctional oligoribonuclease/PAP phosphatase NrnA [Lachnospiraceae bacterium]